MSNAKLKAVLMFDAPVCCDECALGNKWGNTMYCGVLGTEFYSDSHIRRNSDCPLAFTLGGINT